MSQHGEKHQSDKPKDEVVKESSRSSSPDPPAKIPWTAPKDWKPNPQQSGPPHKQKK